MAAAGRATTQSVLVEEEGPLVMQSGKLAPFDNGKSHLIDPSSKNRKKPKKLVRFPSDDCEFYSNIWDAPVSTKKAVDNQKFLDIVQVAHALTMIDYKSDYEYAAHTTDANMWSMANESGSESPADEPNHDEDNQPKSSEVRRILSQDSNRSLAPPAEYRTLNRLLSMQGGPSARFLAVPPPTKHDGGRFIFSAVLSQVDLRDRWSSKFLLGLHEPVRHALYVIDRFLERVQLKSTTEDWNTATFFSWFGDYFCAYIQAQQHIKAAVLRPLVQIKYAAKREIVECYEEITFMLDAIRMQEDLLRQSMQSTASVQSLPRRLQGLQEDIRKLNVVLYHVLNIEERALQPALIATFNEETFYRFVMPRVFRAARPKRLVIPWIIERSKVWGGDQDVTMFKKQLSFPSRFLYDRVWYPHFARHVVAAMKVLDITMTEMPTDAADDSWFGCAIQ